MQLELRPAKGLKIAGVYGIPGKALKWIDGGAISLSIETIFLSRKKGAIFVALAPAAPAGRPGPPPAPRAARPPRPRAGTPAPGARLPRVTTDTNDSSCLNLSILASSPYITCASSYCIDSKMH